MSLSARYWWLAGLSVLVLGGAVAFMLWPTEPPLPGAGPEPASEERHPSIVEQLQAAERSGAPADAGVGELVGQVLTVAGDPVPNAEVWVAAGDAPALASATCEVCGNPLTQCVDPDRARELLQVLRSGGAGRRVLGTTRSDAQGRFRFADLPRAGVTVFARAPGLAEGHQTVETDDLPPEPEPGEDGAQAVPEPGASEVVIELSPSRRAVGVVRNEAEEAVPGARVAIADFQSGTLVELTTDGEGHFPIVGRSEFDSFWLFVEATGYRAQVLPESMPDGENELSVTLSHPKRLRVEVTSGSKPAEAMVNVTGEYNSHPRHVRAAQGVAVFEELGGYEAEVSAELDALVAPTQSIELKEGETVLHLELRKVSRVTVAVLDGKGQPVNDVLVGLNGLEGGDGQSASTVEGQAVFEKVAEGSYQLEAHAERLRQVSRRVQIKPGDNHFELVLEPSTRLTGRVLSAEGRPVARALVRVLSQIDDSPATMTDEAGQFELELDEAGAYELRASEAHAGEVFAKVNAPAENLVLKLEAKGRLVVHVLADRRPQPDVALYVRNEATGDTEPLGQTDEQGTATLAGLGSGSYVLSVEASGFRRPAERPVKVIEGQTVVQTIALDRGALISGRVVDARGHAAAGAQVYATTGEGADSTVSDEQGHFELGGLDPAITYELRALSDEQGTAEALKAKAGATGVTLVLAPHPRVKGRVVSSTGEVVKGFSVDGKPFTTTDGRFEAVATPYEGKLSMSVVADGFEQLAVERPMVADLGDLVLVPARVVSGQVLDAAGQPVLGASVTCDVCLEPSTSGGDGRFTLSGLSQPADGPGELVVATKGTQRGQVMVARQTSITITMNGPTHVDGRVLDATGKPVAARVTVRELSGGDEQKVDATADGHFEVDLSEGLYMFITRAAGSGQTVRVSGPRVSVTLGAPPGTCAVTVTASTPVTDAWLLPGEPQALPPDDLEDDRLYDGAVALDLPMPNRPTRAAGLRCGTYSMVATDSSGVRRERVEVRSAESVFVLGPAPAAPAEAQKLGAMGTPSEPAQP